MNKEKLARFIMKPSHLRYSTTAYFSGTLELMRSKAGVKYRFSSRHYFGNQANEGWKELEVSDEQWR